jgi:hypothetical protein
MAKKESHKTVTLDMSNTRHARVAFKYICEEVLGVSTIKIPRSIVKKKGKYDADDLMRLMEHLGLYAQMTITFNTKDLRDHVKNSGFAKKKRDQLPPIPLITVEDVDTFTIKD